MHEQEQYECFGVPPHDWVGEDGIPRQQFAGSTRLHWVTGEAAILGAEAMPSPPLEIEPR